MLVATVLAILAMSSFIGIAARDPVCHASRQVDACKIHDVVCPLQHLASDRKHGLALQASFASPNGEESFLTVDSGIGWITLEQKRHVKHTCSEEDFVNVTVGFVQGNWPNFFHWLHDQLYPMAMLLREFGLPSEPFQVVVVNTNPHKMNVAVNASFEVLDKLWHAMSGRQPIQHVLGDEFQLCARTAIFGTAGYLGIFPDVGDRSAAEVLLPIEKILDKRDSVQWFAHWVLGKFHVHHRAHQPAGNYQVTVVDRTQAQFPRLVNTDAVVGALRESFTNVKAIEFDQLSFQEQLSVIAHTDVFFAPHGAALTNLLFLPPWAIVIELQSVGHGMSDMDFAWGYCNMARLLGITHVLWHDQERKDNADSKHGYKKCKDHPMKLSKKDAVLLAEMALEQLALPLAFRNFDTCIEVNKPIDMLRPEWGFAA